MFDEGVKIHVDIFLVIRHNFQAHKNSATTFILDFPFSVFGLNQCGCINLLATAQPPMYEYGTNNYVN